MTDKSSRMQIKVDKLSIFHKQQFLLLGRQVTDTTNLNNEMNEINDGYLKEASSLYAIHRCHRRRHHLRHWPRLMFDVGNNWLPYNINVFNGKSCFYLS